jgi:hypothetical protein
VNPPLVASADGPKRPDYEVIRPGTQARIVNQGIW